MLFSKTYPSFLTVKEGFFLPLRLSCKERLFSKTYPSFLTVKEGFFLPLRLSCKERLFSKTYPSFLTVKEGSTSHLGLLSSGEKKETALLGARNRYALRLADHQRSSPCCAGWDRLGMNYYGKATSQLQRRHYSIPSLLKSLVESLHSI